MVPIRLGFVGHGAWGQRLLSRAQQHPDFVVAGVADPRQGALETVPRGLARLNGLDELGAMAPDALVIAVDPRLQGGVTARALALIPKAFVEKPLALRVEEAGVVARAALAGAVVLVDHLPRYMRVRERAHELLEQRQVARSGAVFTLRHGARPRPDVSGLWTLGPHEVALLDSVTGGFEHVRAASDGAGRVLADGETLSGARFRIWVGSEGPSRRLSLYFDEGELLWVDEAQLELREGGYAAKELELLLRATSEAELGACLTRLHRASQRVWSLPDDDSVGAALTDFAVAVRELRAPRCDALEGLRVVAMLAAIERSLHNGSRRESTGLRELPSRAQPPR